MKLVMVTYESDGCSYGYDITTPFEYESKEQAEYDFLTLVENARRDDTGFKFLGMDFYTYQFYQPKYGYNHKGDWAQIPGETEYKGPEIYTLDEWFEANKS